MLKRLIAEIAIVAALIVGGTYALADHYTPGTEPWDPPIQPSGEPAWEDPDQPGYYVCWNQNGYPLPQQGPICPDGWAGRAPENPIPPDWNNDGVQDDADAHYWENAEQAEPPIAVTPEPTPAPTAEPVIEQTAVQQDSCTE